ncbi:MAG: hypothetical protein AB9907_13255 [Flexilinea sp.]
MYRKFYELVKENSKSQGIDIGFSKDLFLNYSLGHSYKTNILQYTAINERPIFLTMVYFALRNQLINRKQRDRWVKKLRSVDASGFQRTIINNILKSGDYLNKNVVLENNISNKMLLKQNNTGTYRFLKTGKKKLRKSLYSIYWRSPKPVRQLIQFIWDLIKNRRLA